MDFWKKNFLYNLLSESKLISPYIFPWDSVLLDLFQSVFNLSISNIVWKPYICISGPQYSELIQQKNNHIIYLSLHSNDITGNMTLCLNKSRLHSLLSHKFKSQHLQNCIDIDPDILTCLIDFIISVMLMKLSEHMLNISGFSSASNKINTDPDSIIYQHEVVCSSSIIGEICVLIFIDQVLYHNWQIYSSNQQQNFHQYIHSSWLNEMPITVSFDAGRTLLCSHDITKLEPGDCILMEWGQYYNRAGALDISICNKPIFYGQVSIDGLYVTIKDVSAFIDFDEGAYMANINNLNKSNDNIISAVNDAELCMIFELGRQQIKMKELLSISNGYTFALPKGDQVLLRVCGNYIGTGRLVRIGESLGIQVVSIEQPSSEQPSSEQPSTSHKNIQVTSTTSTTNMPQLDSAHPV